MSHDYESWKYPAGEVGVRLKVPEATTEFLIKSSDDLMEMYCYLQAKVFSGQPVEEIYLPYLPYSRQDRVVTPGDPVPMLLIANTLKYCKVKKVKTDDVHSDRAVEMFELHGIELESLVPEKDFISFMSTLPLDRQIVLVQPDNGASSRVLKLQRKLGYEARRLIFTKVRDPESGAITGLDYEDYYKKAVQTGTYKPNALFVVIDDICDGGRTFTEIGKILKRDFQTAHKALFVTHGIFSKGFNELEEYYNTIGWKNRL